MFKNTIQILKKTIQSFVFVSTLIMEPLWSNTNINALKSIIEKKTKNRSAFAGIIKHFKT
jgi:hypothetical protein